MRRARSVNKEMICKHFVKKVVKTGLEIKIFHWPVMEFTILILASRLRDDTLLFLDK